MNPDLISQLAAGRVLVVGDVMIDHYVTGAVSRVSDEAPVPIIRVESERWTSGGAANVAANIAALGGSATIVGVIGQDPTADKLLSIIDDMGPSIEASLVMDPERATTIKTRFMGGQHQIVRVDREASQPVSDASDRRVAAMIPEIIGTCRAVILSDYAKGVITDRVAKAAITAGRAAGAVTLVDPKRPDWTVYRGADYITPNRKELTVATGLPCGTDAECAKAADAAMSITGAAILLTRSEKGMSLFRPGVDPLHLPTRAREVFDVSGAGDTVAASVALALAAGIPVEAAVAIANLAAGVVVGKRGTATASPSELLAELEGPRRGGRSEALPLLEAKALRQRWAAQGLKVGFTNGCFDLLHPGHISLVRQAAATCDRLIVALNTDASVRRLKGPSRPTQSEAARSAVMAAVKGVDAVILFDEDTPLEAIAALQPDVLIKGADYTESQIVGADIVRNRGGRIVRVDLVEGQSTSKIIEKAKSEV